MNKYLVEGVGTFFLVTTIAFSANPIAIGVMLMAMIYMGGYISGAHYNPAVTLAVYLQKAIKGKDAAFYVVSQFVGGIAASLLFSFVKHSPFIVQPGPTYDFTSVFLAEILFTFALCSVILHTAVSKKNTPNQFYGFAIGAIVMAGAFSVGTISGGAFNPAVGISPLIANIQTISEHSLNILLYVLGPCIGAILASFAYTFVTKTTKS